MYDFRRVWALARHSRAPVLAAGAIYLLSCALPAATRKGTWEDSFPGIVLLINGVTWICGCLPLSVGEALWKGRGNEVGRLFFFTLMNWSAWLANPLFWCAIWQYWEGKRTRARVLSGAAVVAAGFFYFSEDMWQLNIWRFPAYYFWLASSAVLAAFSFLRPAKSAAAPAERHT